MPDVTTTSPVDTFMLSADQAAMRTNLGLGSLATQSGTFSGISSGTNTGDQDLSGLVPKTTTVNGQPLSGNVTVATITGNAGTATALATARNINGTPFDGTANITVTAAAGTLTGGALASGVTSSSLTSFGASIALGTPGSGVLTNCTGLPIAGISGLGTGVATLLGATASGGTALAGTSSPTFTGTLNAANVMVSGVINVASANYMGWASSIRLYQVGNTLRVRDNANSVFVDVYCNSVVLNTSTPASASATGVAGTVTWDNAYIYVCVATNTWKRVAIATW